MKQRGKIMGDKEQEITERELEIIEGEFVQDQSEQRQKCRRRAMLKWSRYAP